MRRRLYNNLIPTAREQILASSEALICIRHESTEGVTLVDITGSWVFVQHCLPNIIDGDDTFIRGRCVFESYLSRIVGCTP